MVRLSFFAELVCDHAIFDEFCSLNYMSSLSRAMIYFDASILCLLFCVTLYWPSLNRSAFFRKIEK